MDSDRRPQWIYGVGEEPDYRFSLANERTLLAWVRTSLGLIGGGVAVDALGVGSPAVQALLATLLVLIGGVCSAAAWFRWARVERALRERGPLPAASLTWLVTGAVTLIALLVLVVEL